MLLFVLLLGSCDARLFLGISSNWSVTYIYLSSDVYSVTRPAGQVADANRVDFLQAVRAVAMRPGISGRLAAQHLCARLRTLPLAACECQCWGAAQRPCPPLLPLHLPASTLRTRHVPSSLLQCAAQCPATAEQSGRWPAAAPAQAGCGITCKALKSGRFSKILGKQQADYEAILYS